MYVSPILACASSVWSLIHVREITMLESVMRRFSKRLSGLKDMEYGERLDRLKSMTLDKRKIICRHDIYI